MTSNRPRKTDRDIADQEGIGRLTREIMDNLRRVGARLPPHDRQRRAQEAALNLLQLLLDYYVWAQSQDDPVGLPSPFLDRTHISISSDRKHNPRVSFLIRGKLKTADLRNVVLPTIDSLARINMILASARRSTRAGSLHITAITFGSPLEISLGGWIPETLEQIREWRKDKRWRDEHEKLMAELERCKTEAELRLKELEIREKQLAHAKELIELIGVADIPEGQKWTLAAQLIPEFRLLLSTRVEFTDD